MPQHFLLSAASRRLSLVSVAKLSDAEAWSLLVSVRSGDRGEQACPACGVYRMHSFLKCRRQWRCKDCGHTFSITSGTVFANTKLSHKTLLLAMALYVHAARASRPSSSRGTSMCNKRRPTCWPRSSAASYGPRGRSHR